MFPAASRERPEFQCPRGGGLVQRRSPSSDLEPSLSDQWLVAEGILNDGGTGKIRNGVIGL